MLGSGQLGRMMALAACRMGYRVHTLSPATDTPTGQVADLEIAADYDDLDAIRTFAGGVDVITFEFENVSAAAADAAAEFVPVRPSGAALHITQQRAREKAFLADRGFPVPPFARVQTIDELAVALGSVGLPAIVKTAAFGYDGKGQHRIDRDRTGRSGLGSHRPPGRHRRAGGGFRLRDLRRRRAWAGWRDRRLRRHREPARQSHPRSLRLAGARRRRRLPPRRAALTRRIIEELGYVGVLCVEFFVTRDDRLLVNEIAPRPHNSGHLTIEACATSQFEQQVRAVCGLPLGSHARRRGQPRWSTCSATCGASGEPDWDAALAVPGVSLHLYGKGDPRAGPQDGTHHGRRRHRRRGGRARVGCAGGAVTRRCGDGPLRAVCHRHAHVDADP